MRIVHGEPLARVNSLHREPERNAVFASSAKPRLPFWVEGC
jgi:hypothetical protein